MAFLNFSQVQILRERLSRFFSRGKDGKKKRKRIFFALEPKLKLVHIIFGDDMLDKVLRTLSGQLRALKQFKNGSLYQEISVKLTEWGLMLDEDDYTNTKSWGEDAEFKAKARLYNGKIFFVPSNNVSEVESTNSPVLTDGKQEHREQFLSSLASKFAASEIVKNVGIPIDHDFRERVEFEINEALKLVRDKLKAPINLGGNYAFG